MLDAVDKDEEPAVVEDWLEGGMVVEVVEPAEVAVVSVETDV